MELLKRVSERRNSPDTLNESIVQSRVENVYAPKLDWLNNTLRLHGMTHPRVVEITTLPSPFTQLLEQSPLFAEVTTIEQNQFSLPLAPADPRECDAAVLLEALDRAHDPGPGVIESH